MGAIWKSLKEADFGHDDLDMMIMTGVRASLRAAAPMLEEALVVAAVQRYVVVGSRKRHCGNPPDATATLPSSISVSSRGSG